MSALENLDHINHYNYLHGCNVKNDMIDVVTLKVINISFPHNLLESIGSNTRIFFSNASFYYKQKSQLLNGVK